MLLDNPNMRMVEPLILKNKTTQSKQCSFAFLCNPYTRGEAGNARLLRTANMEVLLFILQICWQVCLHHLGITSDWFSRRQGPGWGDPFRAIGHLFAWLTMLILARKERLGWKGKLATSTVRKFSGGDGTIIVFDAVKHFRFQAHKKMEEYKNLGRLLIEILLHSQSKPQHALLVSVNPSQVVHLLKQASC